MLFSTHYAWLQLRAGFLQGDPTVLPCLLTDIQAFINSGISILKSLQTASLPLQLYQGLTYLLSCSVHDILISSSLLHFLWHCCPWHSPANSLWGQWAHHVPRMAGEHGVADSPRQSFPDQRGFRWGSGASAKTTFSSDCNMHIAHCGFINKSNPG